MQEAKVTTENLQNIAENFVKDLNIYFRKKLGEPFFDATINFNVDPREFFSVSYDSDGYRVFQIDCSMNRHRKELRGLDQHAGNEISVLIANLAHEYGHHLQYVMRIRSSELHEFYKHAVKRSFTEAQADYISGMVMGFMRRKFKIGKKDLEAIKNSFSLMGSEVEEMNGMLVCELKKYDPNFTLPGGHASSERRVLFFEKGYKEQNLDVITNPRIFRTYLREVTGNFFV